MTKFQALQSFFSSFGIPAIEENSFYSADVSLDYPYLTYPVIISKFGKNPVTLNPSVWYHTYSWQEPEQKVDEISASISRTGKVIPCEDGYILIRIGDNFCIPMGDESDKFIRRMYLTITVEYFTTN